MNSDQSRIKSLFQKHLEGTASAEEVRELFGLIGQEKGDEEILSSLDSELTETDPLNPYDRERWDLVFDKIKDDTAAIEEDVVPVKKKATGFLRIAVAAAIAVAVFGTGLFYYQHTKSLSQADQQNFVNDVSPGGNKAILTLASGQKISLTDAVNGKIATQAGVVITKTADGRLVYDATGSDNDGVEYNTVEAPVGGQWEVKLPDGSIVFLNALSSITYPTRFVGGERNVKISGEAYFEVAHNKSMPFKVSSQGQTVEVLGTHFDLMAYPDEKVIKTTLLEGSVKIAKNGRSLLLKPGEQAQVTAGGIKITKDVDLEDVVAWKNGYFKFNESLESIMNKVARWYNVEVVYQEGLNKDQSFSGKILRSKNISSVLKIMELTEKVHFKIEGRQIIVMK